MCVEYIVDFVRLANHLIHLSITMEMLRYYIRSIRVDQYVALVFRHLVIHFSHLKF